MTNGLIHSILSKCNLLINEFPKIIMGETIYGGTIASNLNTINKNGWYTCYGSATGAPSTSYSWFITHQNSNAGTQSASQMAIAYSDELIVRVRNKRNGVWQEWTNPLSDKRYKGLRLAKRIVLEQAVASVSFNTDSDGNALNSTLGNALLVFTPENTSITTNARCYLRLNNISTSVYWEDSSTLTSSVSIGSIGSVMSETKTDIDLINNNVIVNSIGVYKNSTAGGKNIYGGGITTSQSAITDVAILFPSGTLPAGTIIEYWERG